MIGRLATSAALLLCLAGLAGAARVAAAPPSNGVEAKSPDAIVAAALAAGEAAQSVHAHGSGVDGGQRVALDVHIGKRRGRGSMKVFGSALGVIRIGSTAYFRAGVPFWRKAAGAQGAALAPLFAGKWMEGSASSGDLAELATLLDLRGLLHALLFGHGSLENDGTTTFHGQPAVALRDTTQGGTLYVATTGPAYPLGVRASGKEAGTFLFDHWNAPLTVTAPKHAIDLRPFLKH